MTDSVDALVVLGDSVPAGDATDAVPWPHRVQAADAVRDGLPVVVRGDTGTTLASLADDAAAHLDAAFDELAATEPQVAVLVHAGHNDAQLSGGDPRVSETEFRHAGTVLDRTLAGHHAVERHGFVGLVPLLPAQQVSLTDAQPDRSLTYDEALAASVADHCPVARPVGDWADQTADGVHPNADGHATVAEAATNWFV